MQNLILNIKPASLNILCSHFSMGSTSLALNMAEYLGITLNKKVAIFSLALSEEQIRQKLLCLIAKIDVQRYYNHNLSAQDNENLQMTLKQVKLSSISIIEGLFNVTDIKTKAKSIGKLDFLIIDYLELIEEQDVLWELKNLAKGLNIPVFVISKLSRNPFEIAKKTIYKLSDLREDIQKYADTIMILHREKYFNKLLKKDIAKIYVYQNNFLQKKLKFLFKPATMNFSGFT